MNRRSTEIWSWTKAALALAVLSALCMASAAQENSAEILYQRGQELMENGSYFESIAAFDRAIEIDPENASIWMGKGDALIRMGNYNESTKIYEKALVLADAATKDNPQDSRAWFVEGQILARQFKNDEAIGAYDRATQLDPGYAEAWYFKGSALHLKAGGLSVKESTETYEEALYALNRSIEADPEYGLAWCMKGYTLSSLGFNSDLVGSDGDLGVFNESLEAFDKAVEFIPAGDAENLALAWDGKALALVGMGNLLADMSKHDDAKNMYEEALKACDMAIELDPNFTGLEARLTKAGILSELGRYDESLQTYDESIESMPADMAAYTSIIMSGKGDVLVEMGRYDEARSTFDSALQMDPMNAGAWKGKGDALNGTGRYDESISAYDKAIELSPELGLIKAYAWHGKGDALKASGRQAEADAAFARARELGYR